MLAACSGISSCELGGTQGRSEQVRPALCVPAAHRPLATHNALEHVAVLLHVAQPAQQLAVSTSAKDLLLVLRAWLDHDQRLHPVLVLPEHAARAREGARRHREVVTTLQLGHKGRLLERQDPAAARVERQQRTQDHPAHRYAALRLCCQMTSCRWRVAPISKSVFGGACM